MAAVRTLQLPIEVPQVDVHQWWHARFNRDPFSQWLRQTAAQLFGEAPPARRPR